MTFEKFADLINGSFNKLAKNNGIMFKTAALGDKMYDLYLNSFPVGSNGIFKTHREYECSACHHFIRAFGNIVFIVDNKLQGKTFRPSG